MSTYEEKNTWVITGVSKEFRKQAKESAKLLDLSIGEYIEGLIYSHNETNDRLFTIENNLGNIESKLKDIEKILADIFEKDYMSQPQKAGWFSKIRI